MKTTQGGVCIVQIEVQIWKSRLHFCVSPCPRFHESDNQQKNILASRRGKGTRKLEMFVQRLIFIGQLGTHTTALL